ncbi:hypothetical protein FACS1894133_6080 [Clostridia bacterium]|nr:hypothetical protein FACS1894133_6080 [Clostridia bacterium]
METEKLDLPLPVGRYEPNDDSGIYDREAAENGRLAEFTREIYVSASLIEKEIRDETNAANKSAQVTAAFLRLSEEREKRVAIAKTGEFSIPLITEMPESETVREEHDKHNQDNRDSRTKREKPKRRPAARASRFSLFAPLAALYKRNLNPRGGTIRIGIVSAAISLVILGGAALYGMFSPAGAIYSLRFAPLVMIVIGVEILVRKYGGGRNAEVMLRFDKASKTIIGWCLLFSLALTAVSMIYGDSGERRSMLANRFTIGLENRIVDIAGKDGVPQLSEVSLNLILSDSGLGGYVTNIKDTDEVSVRIAFADPPPSVSAFASDVYTLLAIMRKLGIRPDTAEFIYDDVYGRVSASLNTRLESEFTANQIALRTVYRMTGFVNDIPDNTLPPSQASG